MPINVVEARPLADAEDRNFSDRALEVSMAVVAHSFRLTVGLVLLALLELGQPQPLAGARAKSATNVR